MATDTPTPPEPETGRRRGHSWLPRWFRPGRLVLLPVDLVVLSVDFVRVLAWYVAVRLKALSGAAEPVIAKRPFLPCGERTTITLEGQDWRACQPGKKYATPMVLALLCSGVQTEAVGEGGTCVLCGRHGMPKPSALRLLGVALALGAIWSLAVAGGLLVRSRFLTPQTVARTDLPRPSTVPTTVAATATESATESAVETAPASAAETAASASTEREAPPESSSEALVLLSESALAMGRRDEARAAAEKALLLAPDDPQSQVQLAEVELAEGHLEVAAQAFRKVLAERPAHVGAGCGLARVLLAQGDSKAAMAQAQAVLQAAPGSFAAAVTLADATLASGDHAAATERFATLNRDYPAVVAPATRYIDLLLRARKKNEALSVARKLVAERPDQTDAQLVLGDTYLRLNLPDQALECAQIALRNSPRGGLPHLLLARIHMAKGNHADAAGEFEGLLRATPGDPGITLALATCREAEGRTDEAIALCQEVAAARPEATAPWLRLARLQTQAGRADDALASARQALAKAPDNPQALQTLADLLLEQPGGLAEAFTLASRAHELAPGRPLTADTLGWIYHLQGNDTQASELLERARGAMPRHALIRYHYAAVLAARGRTQEAIRELAPTLNLPKFRCLAAAQALNTQLQARLAAEPAGK